MTPVNAADLYHAHPLERAVVAAWLARVPALQIDGAKCVTADVLLNRLAVSGRATSTPSTSERQLRSEVASATTTARLWATRGHMREDIGLRHSRFSGVRECISQRHRITKRWNNDCSMHSVVGPPRRGEKVCLTLCCRFHSQILNFPRELVKSTVVQEPRSLADRWSDKASELLYARRRRSIREEMHVEALRLYADVDGSKPYLSADNVVGIADSAEFGRPR
jgi:hypothetical protein